VAKGESYFYSKARAHTYELAKSFRSISLPSFFLKTMERLVDQSIRMGPLKRIPLERSQHAYQRGGSSVTALQGLVSRIESALGHKIFATLQHEVHFMISRWIEAMVRAEIRGVSSTMMVRRGCL
jgi:hypothetical protein